MARPPTAAASQYRHKEMLILCLLALVASALLEVCPDGRVRASLLPEFVLPPTCGSQSLFGIDCPGCGLTRSFIHLARGDLTASLSSHRVGWVLMGLCVVQVPYRTIALLSNGRCVLHPVFTRFLGRFVIALLIVNWVLGSLGA